jgi:hypothetical protein
MYKEQGDEIERNIWGYFSSDGMKSYWTVYLAEDEVEDNHQIAKKFRRLKSTLDRVFVGEPFQAQKFTTHIGNEQVRLIEEAIYTSGEVCVEPIALPGLVHMMFLTDAYGPAMALQQVGNMLGLGNALKDSDFEEISNSESVAIAQL